MSNQERQRGPLKRSKPSAASSSTSQPSTMTSDARFRHVQTDPRFRRAPVAQRKFALDQRFRRMLTDPEFTHAAVLDKYGRRHRIDESEQLKRFYRIGDVDSAKTATTTSAATTSHNEDFRMRDDDEDDGGDMSDDNGGDERDIGKSYLSDRAMAPPSSASDDDDDNIDSRRAVAGDDNGDAGDEGDAGSDSTSLGTDSEASEEDTFVIPQDRDIAFGQPTHRLALLHLDWDKFTAKDLFILLRSFLPNDHEQRLLNVTIYTSQFGKKRMEEEAQYGPVGLYSRFGFNEEAYKQRIEDKVKQLNAKQQQKRKRKKSHSGDDDGDDAEDIADEDADDIHADLDEAEADDADDEALAAEYDLEKPLNDDGDISTTDREDHDDNDNEDNGDTNADELAVDDDDDDETGTQEAAPAEASFSQQALRQYELSRLRYYYAVVTCSCTTAASRLYHDLDGIEWGASANQLDLRFVPDETAFDGDDTKDECNEADVSLQSLATYRAPHFNTRALQHSSVTLTWEEGDVVRDRTLKPLSGLGQHQATGGKKNARKSKADRLAEEHEEDLAVYLASDDSADGNGSDAVMSQDDGDGNEKVVLKKKARAKYSKLLNIIAQADDDGNNTDAQGDGAANPADLDGIINRKGDGAAEFEIKYDPSLRDAANAVVKAVNDRSVRDDESAWQRYLRERKEKRKLRKAQQKAEKDGDFSANKQNDSLYSDDAVDVDLSDPFFAQVMQERQTQDHVAVDADTIADPVITKAKAFFNDTDAHRKTKKKTKLTPSAELSSTDPEAQRRLAELSLLVDDDRRGYNLSKLIKDHKQASGGKKKNKSKDGDASSADPFHINPNDERFRALYDSSEFAIDPTSAQYRATAGTEVLLNERIRRRTQQSNEQLPSTQERQSINRAGEDDSGDLNALVAKIKRRAQQKGSGVATKKQRMNTD